MSETIRSFIAVELDSQIRDQLARIQLQLKKSGADVKWVSPDNIHLTLKFLGHAPAETLHKAGGILQENFKNVHAFEITIDRLGVFPRIERPRVIWVGIRRNADKLREIAGTIDEKLLPLGFEKEEREFSAHMTLGRVRSSYQVSKLSRAVQEYTMKDVLPQTVKKITLFQSTLTPQGPVYTALQEIPFQ